MRITRMIAVLGVAAGLVASPASADVSRTVTGSCQFSVTFTTGNQVVVEMRGRATAAPEPSVSTEIQCTLLDRNGDLVMDLTREMAGPAAVVAGTRTAMANGPWSLCARGEATYLDGSTTYWPGPTAADRACTTP